MLGNWAMGRLRMVTAPTITVTIAITIATIGRFMKNFDILISHVRRGYGRDLHGHAIPDFLYAFHYHSLSGLDSLINNPHRAGSLSDLHRPDANFIVAANDSHLIHALKFRNCFLRYQECRRSDIANEAHATVLTRA